ncbi:heme-binding protein [Parvularcula sp. ZS-1/3]|uniref:Heme-binding protein n=1 Tax=Parvularcula mediterranea TaxID=2732508 RepID=A0A7Y3RMG9_9PROT|nr:heme-binding protein [Parvularcula mediterranea]NNU16286.1 heme-binding protein [Parvularcula mediterranea]
MISALAAAALALTVQTDAPRLNADSTLAIIEGCKAYAEENELAVAIAVLDDRLKMAGYLRMDGVRQGPADLAVKKAEYVASWGHETKVLAEAVGEGRLGWAMTTGGPSVEGGVPVYSDGVLLGSVGVSGAPAVEDAKCARAGIEKAGLRDSR